MAASSASNKTAVNEPRPAATPAEAAPSEPAPGKNAAVAAASSSEAAGDSDSGANGHAPGRRIGDILVDLGYATPEQIDQALDSKEDAYARLGLRLLRKGIDQRSAARATP